VNHRDLDSQQNDVHFYYWENFYTKVFLQSLFALNKYCSSYDNFVINVVVCMLHFCRPPAVFHFNPDKLPVNEGWLPMDTETPAWTDLVPLGLQHESMRHLYMRVLAEFHKTLSQQDCKVHKIYRVQNLDLWYKYQKYVSADYGLFIVV